MLMRYSTTTPARRLEAQATIETPVIPGQTQWTAARCQRLQRPLAAKIASLRKRVFRLEDGSLCRPASAQIDPDAEGETVSQSIRGRTKDEDHDWAPGQGPSKGLKRTYSQRARGRPRIKPRDEAPPTPAIAKLTGIHIKALPNTPTKQPEICHEQLLHDRQSVGAPNSLRRPQHLSCRENSYREVFRQTAKSAAPVNWMIYDGIYCTLSALLKATTKTVQRERLGTRSLLMSCVRSVPNYIKHEQIRLEEEGNSVDDAVDVSSEVHADLEAFGATEDGGWRPFRELARACGIFLLCEALREGFIPANIGRGLTELCLVLGAHDEAEDLSKSMLGSMELLRLPNSPNSKLFVPGMSVPLSNLLLLVEHGGNRSFLYRSLSKGIKSGQIPVEWMTSRDMIKWLNLAIGAFSQCTPDASEALDMLCTILGASIQDTVDDPAEAQHLLRLSTYRKTGLMAVRLSKVNSISANISKPSCKSAKVSGLLTKTISSLIAVLASIAIVRAGRGQSSVISGASHEIASFDDTTGVLKVLAAHMMRVEDVLIREPLNKERSVRRLLLHTAIVSALLPRELITERHLHCKRLITIISNPASISDNSRKSRIDTYLSPVASMLVEMITCCEMGSSDSEMTYKDAVANCLLGLARSYDSPGAAMLAFTMACSLPGTDENLKWAFRIEERAQSILSQIRIPSPFETPAKRPRQAVLGFMEKTEKHRGEAPNSKLQFRWEDSLCEWVTKTPAQSVIELARGGGVLSEVSPNKSSTQRLTVAKKRRDTQIMARPFTAYDCSSDDELGS